MTNGTTRIKNLSIALEAVSRINGCRSEYDRIRDLLSNAIDEEKKEKERQSPVWPAYISPPSTEDIPF